MSERKAILKVGFTHLIGDVSLVLVLEEKLNELTQVTTHWLDPEENPDVVPNGVVLCPPQYPVLIDVELLSRNEQFVEDPEWYPAIEAARTAKALREAEENDL